MNKKIIVCLVGIIAIICAIFITTNKFNESTIETINVTVLSKSSDKLVVQDDDNIIYKLNSEYTDIVPGTNIAIEYTGLIDKNKSEQDITIVNYMTREIQRDENGIPLGWLDNGIFKDYYILAYNKLQELTLDEKIGQLLLVRYPDNNQIEALEKYKFGGYLFFEKDFKDKTEEQVKNMINSLQKVSNIPLLTAVDEEGGSVVRVSSNPNLSKEKFKSSSELYNLGGIPAIKEDTIEKSILLKNLGLNLNLAPVVDVSTDPNDYIYKRTIQQNTSITSNYARTVIEASKGTEVSYTLKHFPGYGNNQDTHTGSSIDNRTLEDIRTNDLPPFEAGIEVGAEAVLVSHNTVTSIDSYNPASLSADVHNLLRNELKFTGIVITDDLSMGAVSKIDNAVVDAILAGNNLIITTDYEKDINSIKNALNDGELSEEQIDELAFKILAWKYYKGMFNTK